jgi:16S rRNA (adenine1518-N6/adenine1519-N6)-dimethyltransferase
VAERIVAKDGKESILSVSVKAYGTPRYVKTVKAGSFAPPPKVDSAILLIDDISRDLFTKNNIEEGEFFSLVKRGFSQKRKKVANNVPHLKEKLAECGISPLVRAEDITLKEWVCLATTRGN